MFGKVNLAPDVCIQLRLLFRSLHVAAQDPRISFQTLLHYWFLVRRRFMEVKNKALNISLTLETMNIEDVRIRKVICLIYECKIFEKWYESHG